MLSAKQLAELWSDHSAALLLLARTYGESADDCVQEAFIRLAVQQPVPDSPVAWLFRVVRNEAVSQQRSRRRRRRRELAVGCQQSCWFDESSANPSGLVDTEELQESLAALEPEVRDVVVTNIWGGRTFREIADTFGISRARAHRLYQQGLRELRQRLVERLDCLAQGESDDN